MARPALPKRELEICKRLKAARETLGITQGAVGDAIGVERSTLTNYESGVSPLRYDVALRFCRSFIISEEWLATGTHASMRREAEQRGIQLGPEDRSLDGIFLRQCMDLLSESLCHQIPKGMLYSNAFDTILAPRYADLVSDFFYTPRLLLNDADGPALASRLLQALQERWFNMLGNEALRLQQNPWEVQRTFTRCLFEVGFLTFKRLHGMPTPEIQTSEFNWLRALALDPNCLFGPLHGESVPPAVAVERVSLVVPTGARQASSRKDLTDQAERLASGGVQSVLPKLIERLCQATAERGRKSELAAWLKVHPQCVTDWLTGRKEPGGETTLRLLQWVEQQERQQKESPGHASPRPEPKAQKTSANK